MLVFICKARTKLSAKPNSSNRKLTLSRMSQSRLTVTHGSLDKFKIYAALGVPELWLYDGEKISFYQLAGDKYNQSETSQALPRLAAADLTGFLRISEIEEQTAALKQFRRWLGEKK